MAAPLLALAPPLASAAGRADVDAQLAASKQAMVARPQAALAAALAAMQAAEAGPPSPARDRTEAEAGWLEGEALTRLNRATEAAPVLQEALRRAQATAPGTKLEADLLKARGAAFADQGRVQDALPDFQAAFQAYGKADVKRGQAIVLQNISEIYTDARDYAHAVKYLKQSDEIFRDDPSVAFSVQNSLGGAYLGLHQDKDALKAFTAAAQTARELKSASVLARTLPNLAEAQMRLGRFADAQASLDAAFRAAAADPAAAAWSVSTWGEAAQLAWRRGRLAEARAALEHVFAGQDLGRTEAQFRDAHETAWKVYSALGDPQRALVHLAAFKRLDDQGRELAASTNAALAGARFDFAAQDLRIARLRAEQLQKDVALAQTRARAQTTLLSTVTAAGAVVIALVLAGFFAMRRSRDAVRRANDQLEQTNGALQRALKAKSQFLATTSHEIRTPLNGILGMTQVLLTDRSLPAAARGRVELVHGAGQTMRALVDDLLDLAKMETGRIAVDKRPLDLPRLLEDTARLWRAEAAGKGLTVTLEAEAVPSVVLEDGDRLRQVLFNLMSNAIKFTDRGGVVLRVRREGGDLAFAVRDTGIGVAPEDQGRVFEPFIQVDGGTTRRHGGTGLGLAICRDVARALGGAITLESGLGEGAVFTLRLPLQEVERTARADTAGDAGRASDLERARVLVVEPNPLARSVLRAVLSPAAAGVEVVAGRAEAEAALAAAAFDHLLVAGEALAEEPATAAAALAALRGAAGGAGATVLLTRPAPELRQAVEAAAGGAALTRPVAPEVLVAAVRAALAAEPARPEAAAA